MRQTLRLIALSVSIAICLACSGLGDGEPDPPERPEPAENAKECESWNGGKLPMRDGIIAECSPEKVVIDHGKDARPIRWEYLEIFRKKNWNPGEPEKGNPVLFRGPDKLTFLSSGNAVTIKFSR